MTERKSWPFKTMAVGERQCFPEAKFGNLKLVSIAAHTYGRQKGWKFTTRVRNAGKPDAYVEVTRLQGEAPAQVDRRTLRRKQYPFESLEVGESCVVYDIEGDRAISAISKRHREGTKRWTAQKVWDVPNVSTHVTITRVA